MVDAELVEDGGRGASGPDFFRSAEFLAAEGATHTLSIESGATRIAAPLVVREVPGGGIDATSPYGYPGFAICDLPEGLPFDPAEIDLRSTGLVSIFIRHVLDPEGDPPLADPTPRNVCLLADPASPRKSRMSDRQQVRKNERNGYSVSLVPGVEVGADDLDGFVRVYTETMERTGAAERYFFDRDYFTGLLGSGVAWLALARDGEDRTAAGSLVVASDDLLHYYLSGTGEANLSDSPMKNVLTALVEFAEGRGAALNLGGGITPGDRLEEFKRGFANREAQWYTQELVCDPAAYERLSAGAGGEGFFPAYRAPGSGGN